jgi:phosphoesterase RecJ-like protein
MTSTRPSYEEQLQCLKQFIEAGDDFLVVSHVNPDGDAISSTVAVGWLLHKLGKKFTMMNEGACPRKFHYLWGAEQIIDHSQAASTEKFTRVIAVDCADYKRIGKVADRFSEEVRIANIDHHPTNDYYGDVHLIRPNAAATAEILYDLLNVFAIEWDETIATCIYTGLLTDTGGFRYSNTTANVMRIASSLLSYGVKANDLSEMLLERLTRSHVALLKRALNTLTFNEDSSVCWLSVLLSDMEETNASNEDLEGLVQYPRNIEGVQIGILFKEVRTDVFKVSMRSSGAADVAKLAQLFGGGGHVRAAGCTIEGKLEDIIARVVSEAEKELKANAQA